MEEDTLEHKFELYPYESFKSLLLLEVNRTRRYKTPLSLIQIAIETEPDNADARHSAEMFAINVLDTQLRGTDVPCMFDGEFLVLMPATDETGGRVVCNRLAEALNTDHQKYDRVSFQIKAYIGMTTLGASTPVPDTLLLKQARAAMQHARERKSNAAVLFSKIK